MSASISTAIPIAVVWKDSKLTTCRALFHIRNCIPQMRNPKQKLIQRETRPIVYHDDPMQLFQLQLAHPQHKDNVDIPLGK